MEGSPTCGSAVARIASRGHGITSGDVASVSVDPQVVRDWVALAHEEEGSPPQLLRFFLQGRWKTCLATTVTV